ncbi:putative LPS glycosyltransferase [Microdochium trichocladiopsis]|uniref:LPS glycosyltransferase n=1 Tax=Microdochium trichocladiopsis TaxID=1682393 RepID=A0A9P8XYU0_9PEZI|nr:putative LPS glycosyltransferase [Microdochium trichocladiopsis]KAH7021525.1 putative LPS glycosyltransferase [Microdochium trichocladiopsis]
MVQIRGVPGRSLYSVGIVSVFVLISLLFFWVPTPPPRAPTRQAAIPNTIPSQPKPAADPAANTNGGTSNGSNSNGSSAGPGLVQQSTGKIIDHIYNRTLGFGDILSVSLPSRTDRRDSMHLQSSLSGFHVTFVDGVNGDDVVDKAIPNTFKHDRMRGSSIGSWRGHMNAIQQIVDRNLASALITEDDLDWDIRIHDQLYDFALSARALIQPLAGTQNQYHDPTFPKPGKNSPDTVPDIDFAHLPETEEPKISPYGDDWDVLWIGHCGMHFPFKDDVHQPKGRVVHKQDETVAMKKYLRNIPQPFTLSDDYPQHTRVVHHAEEGVCTLAYAVSLQGAQKLIYELGLKDVTDQYDILLRFFCNGFRGRKPHRCLTVQPSLFHHFHAKGPKSASSDIDSWNADEFVTEESSDMVRWSVRLNAETLMEGGTVFSDQYPDSVLP